nr:DNA-directed DNA polymerase [Tanacetum cinerariifolium]
MRSILGSFFQNQPSTSGTLPSNTVPTPKGEMKAVTTRSGLAYEGPSIPTESPFEKVDEQNTEEILDKEHSNSSGSTAQVQPPVVPILISEPDVPRTQTKPTIPYPSRLNDQKLREKATNQMEIFFQIFHDLHFDINFTDALLLMQKFSSTIKSLLANKDKLFELAKVSLNENCSAMLLKKLSKKLGDLELTPTRMTLKLADRSITRPKGVAEDVFVKVGKFHFPTDFVVVDFEADPRVPLILGRSFLRTGRALIDVYGEEITLRMNRVDVIDIACKEFVQDVLDFQYNPKSSSPTLVSDASVSESDSCKEPIVKSSLPTLTPFGESDFFLKEIEDFLNDDSIPTGIENSVYDPEGDILFLEKLLNEDPFQLPPMDLKLAEESKAKSSVEEPPELELKELPSHFDLINVLKSHKWAIVWKISDIKGIDPRFCTHEILIEDDYNPTVHSQRRVNPKIHDVIKKEVIKLLDAGMIYPISDSPWVSLIHCVPKKGGTTVVSNENNELIPTRLVTDWRVCIDYRKLNDATRKDHFPLPFMDQMLERLAENEFYCFLDGFSGYFQILIDPQDQEKTTFTCPYGTFAYRRMPFGLCNAPGTFQREGVVLGHKISKSGIEVDRAKVDVITKLPHPTTIKGVRSFLGHVGFYHRFIQDFSKIVRPMTHLLEMETPFVFSKEYKKGSENPAADHLSRLENQHHDVLENKDINENFPLETLGSLTSHSTPWFADIANFYAGNFIKKGLTSQQKKKEFNVVFMGKKLLKSSKLAMRDLLGAIMVPIHSEEDKAKSLKEMRCLRTVSKFVRYSIFEVEAKALPTNDARVVVNFLKSLFSRFGIPRVIISDRGTHFCNDQFTRVMIKYGVTHRPATAYHPQTSGQVKVSDRRLKRILKRMVGENHASWAYWGLKHVNFDLKTAGDHRKLQLNELSELCDQAYENSVIYKERTKKLHDSKIKNRIFNVGDQVLLFNSRLKIFSGKLKTRWSGPFTITCVYPYGTIELSQPNGLNFKVNGHRVKHYFGGDIPSNVAPDLYTFPIDN